MRRESWAELSYTGWAVCGLLVLLLVTGEAAVLAVSWRIGIVGALAIGALVADLLPPRWWHQW